MSLDVACGLPPATEASSLYRRSIWAVPRGARQKATLGSRGTLDHSRHGFVIWVASERRGFINIIAHWLAC